MEAQKTFIRQLIRRYAHLDSKQIMDNLLEDFKLHYDRPVSSMNDLRDRDSKKVRGDMLEAFCQMYFEEVVTKNGTHWYTNVWLLNEVPEKVRNRLKLKKQDLGIDLVLQDLNGEFSAVQVKYRQHPKYKSKNVIGWKQLSTFYALVKRTGEGNPASWKKHIVFTNADFIRHVGEKDPKDQTYAIGSLRRIKKDHWMRMIGDSGQKVTQTKIRRMTREQLREARLKAFSKLN